MLMAIKMILALVTITGIAKFIFAAITHPQF